MESNWTWITDIVLGLRALDGEARLQDLYRWIRRNRTGLPKSWEAIIRAQLQAHCPEAPQYRPGCPKLFRNTGRGWWAIRQIDEIGDVKMPYGDLVGVAIQRMSEPELEEWRQTPDKMTFLNQKVETVKSELLKGKGIK